MTHETGRGGVPLLYPRPFPVAGCPSSHPSVCINKSHHITVRSDSYHGRSLTKHHPHTPNRWRRLSAGARNTT